MRTTEDARNEPSFSDILVVLGGFLEWATEDNAIYGGYHAEEAMKALQQLLGWDDEKMFAFRQIFVDN